MRCTNKHDVIVINNVVVASWGLGHRTQFAPSDSLQGTTEHGGTIGDAKQRYY